MRSQFIVSLVLCSVLVPSAVIAQPSQTDRSLAQSLFEQAKQLMDEGNYAEACPKLAESQRLDPGGGTLLNLGLCHEKEGKIASAWSDFKEALSAARRDGRADRIKAAEDHIAALELKLPWITLDVLAPVEGQEVTLRGAAVGKAGWSTPVSVDPGTHLVGASAPGYKPWSSTIKIAVGEKKTVTVPALENEPTTEPAPAVPATPTATLAEPQPAMTPARQAPPETDQLSDSAGRSVAGWLIGGVGVATIGVGSYFGVRTLRKRSESDRECEDDNNCTGRGVRLNEEAYTSAWISNIGFGVGLVGVGVGTYLLLSGDESGVAAADSGLLINAQALPGSGQVTLEGQW